MLENLEHMRENFKELEKNLQTLKFYQIQKGSKKFQENTIN